MATHRGRGSARVYRRNRSVIASKTVQAKRKAERLLSEVRLFKVGDSNLDTVSQLVKRYNGNDLNIIGINVNGPSPPGMELIQTIQYQTWTVNIWKQPGSGNPYSDPYIQSLEQQALVPGFSDWAGLGEAEYLYWNNLMKVN